MFDFFTEYILPIFLTIVLGAISILLFTVLYTVATVGIETSNECNCIVEKAGGE